MTLYMVRVADRVSCESNWFFVAAKTIAEVQEMCEDYTSVIIEILESSQDMIDVIRRDFDCVALVANT